MPVLISAAVLCSALYVVLSKDAYPDAHQKWAFGAVGTILGYWFKRVEERFSTSKKYSYGRKRQEWRNDCVILLVSFGSGL